MTSRRSEKSNGKQYELKLAQILEEMYPAASIRKNVYLPGNITGSRRQIDVLVDEPHGLTDYEAKDHSRNIGIDTIAAYGFKVRDEGVPYAVMVSNSPYAPSAINTAIYHNIRLAHLIDSTDESNGFSISQNVLLENRFIESYAISVRDRSTDGGLILPAEVSEMQIWIDGKLKNAKEILAEKWKSNKLSDELGQHSLIFHNQDVAMVNGDIRPVTEIELIYIVGVSYHKGIWGIEEARGLYDVTGESFRTSSTVTSKILSQEEMSSWPEITVDEANEGKYSMKIQSKSG